MTEITRERFEKIAGLLATGNVQQAENACRREIARGNDDVNVLGLLGAILLGRGALDEAESFLQRAIDVAPQFARPHEDLGALYLSRNEPQRAIAFLEKAVALDPQQVSAQKGLAAARQQAGHAATTGQESTADARTPDIPTLLAEANRRRERGDLRGTERLCDQILKAEAEHTGALRILAMAATDEERFVVAEGFLKRIAKLKPDSAASLRDLGQFLGDRGRYAEAITQLERAATLAPEEPGIYIQLGNMLAIIGQTEKALTAFDACLLKQPADPAALIGRGHMLRIIGRKDEANDSYRNCVAEHPAIGSAWWYLASLGDKSLDDRDIAIMRQQLTVADVKGDEQVGLHFALARAYEAKSEFEPAWMHYASGNKLKRTLVSYDPVKEELDRRRVVETYDADLLSRQAKTPTDMTPIFIVGMPRSGSTLIEQVLANHSQVQGTGELPYIITLTCQLPSRKEGSLYYTEVVDQLDEQELTKLGKHYLQQAAMHCTESTPFLTDKMPANFAHIGLIHQILPHARVIDARRDPLATCVANYRQLFAQGKNQSYDLTELGEYYLQYASLMSHWDIVLPDVVLPVQYEDVVNDLEREVRRILDYCQLPFEASCVEFYKSSRLVNTASAEQVRQPIYRSGLDFHRHYDAELGELREVLAPLF